MQLLVFIVYSQCDVLNGPVARGMRFSLNKFVATSNAFQSVDHVRSRSAEYSVSDIPFVHTKTSPFTTRASTTALDRQPPPGSSVKTMARVRKMAQSLWTHHQLQIRNTDIHIVGKPPDRTRFARQTQRHLQLPSPVHHRRRMYHQGLRDRLHAIRPAMENATPDPSRIFEPRHIAEIS